MTGLSSWKKWCLVTATLLCLSACTALSNRAYVERMAIYGRIKRVAVFVQRWPVYLQLQGESNMGEEFIKTHTVFVGPWKPAEQMHPRAVDIRDIDDAVVEKILIQTMENKGYQPTPAEFHTTAPESVTVAEIMARYRVLDSSVDAFLFCFYSPTLFFADAQATPRDHLRRSYSLSEIIRILNPGGNAVIWAGRRAARAPDSSISHAFIYLSMTLFDAQNWQGLWKVADSHVGGKLRLALPRCPPAPTQNDYWADARIIERLMCQNLSCRLRHLIPDAF